MSHANIRIFSLSLLTAMGTAGCAQPVDAPHGDDDTSNPKPEIAAFSGTCDPARAAGAVSSYERALLDTIATTEGTYHNDTDDGYDVAFGYHYFGDCTQHPGVVYCSGSLCSDASGRYQFLGTTWAGLGYPNFYPNDQDLGAMALVHGRGASVPTSRALTSDEFVTVMDDISYEWASLPPGRYGQPSRTMAEAWSIYSGFVAGIHTTPAPSLSVNRNADGRIELFYPGQDNKLYHDFQPSWPGPAQLGGAALQVTSAVNANGSLEVFYIGINNAIYHNYQVTGGWAGEALLGGSAKQLTAARNADGHLEIFYVGMNDLVYHDWQVPGGWHGPTPLQGSAKQIAVAPRADGMLEIVYIGTNNALYHNYQVAGGWAGEALLGGSASQVAIGSNPDGRLEIFYVGLNQAIYHNYEVRANTGPWSGELSLGGSAKQLSVGSNADGRLEVFYVGTNSALFHRAQTTSGWGAEAALGGAAKLIQVEANADGRLEVFYIGTDNALYHNYQLAPNSGWAGQRPLGGSI